MSPDEIRLPRVPPPATDVRPIEPEPEPSEGFPLDVTTDEIVAMVREGRERYG